MPNLLSKRWYASKTWLTQFIDTTIVPIDTSGSLATIKKWLKAVTTDATSTVGISPEPRPPEKFLNDELIMLDNKRGQAFDAGGNGHKATRRSARLLCLVQGAVGVKPGGKGFSLEVGAVHGGQFHGNGNGSGANDKPDALVKAYRDQAVKASEAAAWFIYAVRNKGASMDAIVTALKNRLDENRDINPVLWNAIDSIVRTMETGIARGGAGEESAYWPSTWVSSSSSSSSS